MTNFKGTKGKWVKHAKSYMTIISDNGVLVANCGGRSSNVEDLTEEQSANTQLISKAPEMLEMLERASSLIKSLNCSVLIDEIEQLIKEATEL